MQEGRACEIIDGGMTNKYYSEDVTQALRCVHVSLLCVQQRPGDRPCMSSVLLMLTGETSHELPPPKPPGYFVETYDRLPESDSLSRTGSLSTCDMTITVMEAR